MEIDIIEQSEQRMSFVISGVETHFINALRRTLLADIPKLAIEDVDFHLGPISDENKREYESISPIFDEMIAHRLGMLPIPTDLNLFGYRSECRCNGEGCPNCTVMYSIKKMGPCMVYSGDLEPVNGDSKLRIKDDRIPIVKLEEGQGLLIYATAQLGTGREHAKWSVTHGVGYKHYPKIEIDHKKCDRKGGCIQKCPKKILKRDAKNNIVVENIEKCTLCRACEEFCDLSHAIKVGYEPNKFIFQFETDGSLSAKEALKRALETMALNVEKLGACIESLEW